MAQLVEPGDASIRRAPDAAEARSSAGEKSATESVANQLTFPEPLKEPSLQASFRIEEFKALRDETLEIIRDIQRTELAGAIATASIFTWLLTHKDSHIHHLIWFLPSCIIMLCGYRCLDCTLRLLRLGAYIRRVEKSIFSENDAITGWENYKVSHGHRGMDIFSSVLAGIVWVAVFIATAIGSVILSK